MANGKTEREGRLAEALRANLRRRKSQLRARDDIADPGQPDLTRPDSTSADSRQADSPSPDSAGSHAHGPPDSGAV